MTAAAAAKQTPETPRTQNDGFESVPCNQCGSENLEHVYTKPDEFFHPDERFSVVRCKDCGLGFLNPRPDQKTIGRYYPADFYDHFEQDTDHHEARYAREADYVERHLAPLPKEHNKRRRLLDVGCANGGFPRHMISRGWDVEGLEIGEDARKIEDFKLYNCLLPDLDIDSAEYDALTAWAVLEHVHDPEAYFSKAQSLLKPGGVFAFLVTNFESPSSYALYKEDVPRHTYFYTEQTVRHYLERNGFELLEAKYGKDIYQMAPTGWLVLALSKLMGRGAIDWEDIPVNRMQWFKQNGLSPSLKSNMLYVLKNPVWFIDRLLMPLYEQWQIARKSYGIVTYVARKK